MIHKIDHGGSQAIHEIQGWVKKYLPIDWAIEKLKNLDADEDHDVDPHVPSPIDLIKVGASTLGTYHRRVLKTTSHKSDEVKKAVGWTFTQIFYPLTFCKTGQAIQHFLSYDILGNLALSVAFCVLQIFHVIPYVLFSALVGGTVTLYQTNPVALTAILAGGMLTTQLWLLYRLVKTVEAARKVFEHKADDFMSKINFNLLNFLWKIGAKASSVFRSFSKKEEAQAQPIRTPIAR